MNFTIVPEINSTNSVKSELNVKEAQDLEMHPD